MPLDGNGLFGFGLEAPGAVKALFSKDSCPCEEIVWGIA